MYQNCYDGQFAILTNKMQRITVSNLINLGKESQILSNEQSVCLQIIENYVFLFLRNGMLAGYDLLTKDQVVELDFREQINQEQELKVKVAINGHILAVIMSGRAEIWVINLQQGNKSQQKMESHMRPITDIIAYGDYLITSSQDMTIRMWQIPKVPMRKHLKNPFALCGHENTINCLSTYGSFLLSGSKDRSMKCWIKDKLYTSFTFDSAIVKIIPCPASEQILVFTADSKINFINVLTILNKKTQIRAALEYEKIFTSDLCGCEINEEFFIFGGPDNVVEIIEVNLVKKINSEERNAGRGTLQCLDFKFNGIFSGYSSCGVKMIQL